MQYTMFIHILYMNFAEMYGLEKMPYKTSAKLAGLMRDIRMQLHVEYPADKNPFGNPK